MRSSNATAADSNENDPTEVSTVYRVYTVGGGSDRNPLHRVSSRAAIGRFRGRSRMDDRLVPWLSYRDRVGGNFWGRKEGERSVVARFSIIRWLRLRFKRCPPPPPLPFPDCYGRLFSGGSIVHRSSPLVRDESSLDYGFDDNPRPPPFVLVLRAKASSGRVPDNGRETTTSLVISFIVDTFRKMEG